MKSKLKQANKQNSSYNRLFLKKTQYIKICGHQLSFSLEFDTTSYSWIFKFKSNTVHSTFVFIRGVIIAFFNLFI